MAFPIIPKKRSGAAGNPGSLTVGELAVNTYTGELFLGADGGVTLLNGPVAAGTTTTEVPGDGTTTAFVFGGYNGTADGGYLVSVGGIDQPPSKYEVTNTAGGTLTFIEAPTAGELISIRAIVAGSGGGGDGNAIQIQGRDVANTLPDDTQVLGWNDANAYWEPVDANAGSNATSLQGTAIAPDLIPNALNVLTWAQMQGGGGNYEWRPRPLGGYSTATAGQGLVYNETNGWVNGDVNAAKIRNQTVVETSPNTSEALVYNGNDWAPAVVNAVKLQGQTISSATPANGNLLKFDGTNWAPFDGLAIPSWNTGVNYIVGDRVWHDGKIWASVTAGSGQTPSTGSSYWAENLGSNNGVPSNQSTPAYWLRITTFAGDGYMSIYV